MTAFSERSKRSPEEAERIPGLHVYMVNCLSRVEVRARLWGFRSDNGDVPGMRFASSGLRLLGWEESISLPYGPVRPDCAPGRARPTNGSDRGSLRSHDLTLFVRG